MFVIDMLFRIVVTSQVLIKSNSYIWHCEVQIFNVAVSLCFCLMLIATYCLRMFGLSQRCSWGLRSSRMWRRVTGQSDADVSRKCSDLIFLGRNIGNRLSSNVVLYWVERRPCYLM